MILYKNKYRTTSMRAQWWNYNWNGSYFITICTQNRVHYFGHVDEEEMIYNELGKIAKEIWEAIPNQFPFVKLGEFIIMPNHTHGILTLDSNSMAGLLSEVRLIAPPQSTQQLIAPPQSTRPPSNNTIRGGFAGEKNPMFHQNISRIIRWYKGRCSFEMRKVHKDFQWQSGYHDRIIRNQIAYNNISLYIQNNPSNWENDILLKQYSI